MFNLVFRYSHQRLPETDIDLLEAMMEKQRMCMGSDSDTTLDGICTPLQAVLGRVYGERASALKVFCAMISVFLIY